MGCPDVYYKRALQYFCRAMHFDKEGFRADRFLEIKDIKELEKEVNNIKAIADEKEAIFTAGRIYQAVSSEANEEGCDAYNAAAGGLWQFSTLFIPDEDPD